VALLVRCELKLPSLKADWSEQFYIFGKVFQQDRRQTDLSIYSFWPNTGDQIPNLYFGESN